MRNLAYDAVDLATRNWRIVPLHTPRGTASGATCDCNRPGCPSVGKHPRVTDWVRQASADLPTVGGWWEQWPAANIGVATGPESGIVVLDIDPRHGGDEEFLRLLREHDNDLPIGPACATGGGGEHYYFKHPGGRVLSRTVAPGIDVKGDGGQVVAPPSVHATGMSYEWYEGRGPDLPCPDLPDWLLMLMQGAPDVPHEGAPVIPSDVPQGERNNTLASFGGSMRSRGASQNTIFAALLAMNDEWSNPLSRNEVATIAASVSRYEPTTAPLIIDIQTKQPQKRGAPPTREPYVPQTYTARQLMALDLPDVKWAVEGLLPEGLAVLAGKPKLGKSWLALDIGLAVAEGGIALGEYPVEDGDVLMLALEDNPRRLQSRVRSRLGDTPAPERLHLETRWPREDEGGVEALDAWLGLHPLTRLVFIDTLAKFRTRGQDAKYADDYAAIENLQQLAGRHGIAIVLITHYRKAFSDDWLDNVTGTLGIAGAADTILGLERPRGATGASEAVLHVTGRDVQEKDFAMKRDLMTAGWLVMGEAAEYRMSREMAEGVAVMTADGAVRTPAAWAPILNKKRPAAGMFLRRAHLAGLIECYDGGLYGPLRQQAATGAAVADIGSPASTDIATPVAGGKSENESGRASAVAAVASYTVADGGSATAATGVTAPQNGGPNGRQNTENDAAATDARGSPRRDAGAQPVPEVRGTEARREVQGREQGNAGAVARRSETAAPFAVSAAQLETPCPGCGEVAWTRRVGNRWMCGTCDPSHVAVGEDG